MVVIVSVEWKEALTVTDLRGAAGSTRRFPYQDLVNAGPRLHDCTNISRLDDINGMNLG